MTNWFLNTFFRGKWFYYGHWSMTHIIGTFIALLIGASFIHYAIGALIAWAVMFLKEVIDWRTKGEFHVPDIYFNSYGGITTIVQGGVLSLISLLIM